MSTAAARARGCGESPGAGRVIASLGMYDLPEIAGHTAALWRCIAAALRDAGFDDVPDTLAQGPVADALLSPDLLLGQTCGYPLTHALAGRVRYVATPCYRAPGCAGGFYRSAFVVREDHPARRLADCRGAVFALNGFDSHSGWNAPRLAMARLATGGVFAGGLVETGAHRASLATVAAGRAGFCAVDCVTLALLRRHAPDEVAGLRVVGWTQPAPGLPLVTRAAASEDELGRLRDALFRAVRRLSGSADADALMLAGLEVLPTPAYRRIVDMEQAAQAHGEATLS